MHSQLQEVELNGLAASHALLSRELAAVNSRIQELLDSEVGLIGELGRYIIHGGKRLRPMLLLLGAGLFRYQGRKHIDLATVIEFIHAATLLHDDVVDHSELRHGRQTANRKWSQEASVLVGDFLYSRAFQIMVAGDNLQVMRLMADITNSIAEGEVRQLIHRGDPKIQEAEYFRIIHSKTARLFEATVRLPAILCARTRQEEEAMGRFGSHFGRAYQLVDDVLDYLGGPGELGKNPGNDLAEGKVTLPLLHALWNAPKQDAERLRGCLQGKESPTQEEIKKILENTGSIQYTMEYAAQEAATAERCLARLPKGAMAESMIALTRWNLERRN